MEREIYQREAGMVGRMCTNSECCCGLKGEFVAPYPLASLWSLFATNRARTGDTFFVGPVCLFWIVENIFQACDKHNP